MARSGPAKKISTFRLYAEDDFVVSICLQYWPKPLTLRALLAQKVGRHRRRPLALRRFWTKLKVSRQLPKVVFDNATWPG
jgi:hypothetical protein